MQVLAYVAAALVAGLGIAHAIPTTRVVAWFGPTTVNIRRVLTQEWLAESFTVWGMAALVVAVTMAGPHTQVTGIVYRVVAGLLVALAILTASPARAPRRCGSKCVPCYSPAPQLCCLWPAFADAVVGEPQTEVVTLMHSTSAAAGPCRDGVHLVFV